VTEHAKTKKTPKNTMEEGGNSRFFHLTVLGGWSN
jgi:hypothetical protein